jgi:hypothetical protein
MSNPNEAPQEQNEKPKNEFDVLQERLDTADSEGFGLKSRRGPRRGEGRVRGRHHAALVHDEAAVGGAAE